MKKDKTTPKEKEKNNQNLTKNGDIKPQNEGNVTNNMTNSEVLGVKNDGDNKTKSVSDVNIASTDGGVVNLGGESVQPQVGDFQTNGQKTEAQDNAVVDNATNPSSDTSANATISENVVDNTTSSSSDIGANATISENVVDNTTNLSSDMQTNNLDASAEGFGGENVTNPSGANVQNTSGEGVANQGEVLNANAESGTAPSGEMVQNATSFSQDQQSPVAPSSDNNIQGVSGNEVTQNSENAVTKNAEDSEEKKPKWKFPKKVSSSGGASVVAGKNGELLVKDKEESIPSDSLKTSETSGAESSASNGNIKPSSENNQIADGNEDEEIEEEVVEEEVVDENINSIPDGEVEEVEEEVEEEVVEDDQIPLSGANATASENVQNVLAGGVNNETSKTQPNEAVAGNQTSGSSAEGEQGQNIGSQIDGNLTSAITSFDENKKIEEDEKRKSKFVLFPKKVGFSGAVNGQGYDKNKIKDKNRSVRYREVTEQTEADIENEIKKPKPLWLKLVITFTSIILSLGVVFGAYLGYLQSGHDRLYDWKYLAVTGNKSNIIVLNQSLEAVTYNLNYGIMSPEFSYYLAENSYSNGNTTKGNSSRAVSKDRVIMNINGSAELASKGSNANVDFVLFQEIDLNSTRSYYVDEKDILDNVLLNFGNVYAETGSSNYVFSPLSSPLGKTDSRMALYSNFQMGFRIRYSLPSATQFLSKYGTNDNCVILTRFKTSGSGMLTIVNVNVSQYEDDEIRESDLSAIYNIINDEYNTKGNYVLVGGSFSYLLHSTEGEFLNNMNTPSWSKNLPECFSADKLAEIGFRICKDEVAVDRSIGTTRDTSTEYNRGVNYEAITDGFIVSNNILVESTEVIDNGYLYSSHNPVKLTFKLMR